MKRDYSIKIDILDIVHSKISDVEIIKPALSYKTFFYRYSQRANRKIRVEYNKSVIVDEKKKIIFTGHIQRVCKYLKKKNIPYEISGGVDFIEHKTEPNLPGFTFFEDQLRLLKIATDEGRGVIVSPTATGKTVLVGALISCYENISVLFLVHTITLLNQAYSDFTKYGFTNVTKFGGKEKDLKGKIVIATKQSLINLPPEKYADLFDMVVVDETHHIAEDGQYAELLGYLMSPLRFGVTATWPSDIAYQLAIEGGIGKIIGEFSLEEAIEKGRIAKPIIKLTKVPYNSNVRELRLYREVRSQGIITNTARNHTIMKDAKKYIDQGLTVLVLINQIEHGELLVEAGELLGLGTIPFMFGKTKGDERELTRLLLHEKKLTCVIANTVWKEGVNIPSLGVIILADAGKKEEALLQLIGRGFRVTEDKKEIIIQDYFDESHPYLISHFGRRVSFYFERGWL